MKRYFTILTNALAIAVIGLSSASCDQSAIFNSITNETAKKDALIQGSPTRFVKVGTTLYVANGYLWERPTTGAGTWTKKVSTTFTYDSGSVATGLKIRDLAAVGTTLYALTVTDTDNLQENTTATTLWTGTDGASWTQITLASSALTYTTLDSLHVANGNLFVGAHKTDTSKTYEVAWAMLMLSGSALELTTINDLADGGKLVGVSHDGTYYYAATTNLGIYRSSDASAWTVMASTSGYNLTGIFSLTYRATNQATVAVGRDENTLIKLTAAATDFTVTDQNYVFDSGEIMEYDSNNDGVPDYLLFAIKSGTTYGYREIALSGGDLTGTTTALSKPSSLSSVNDYDQYSGALGVVPVGHLFQSKEGTTNILYASTVLQGLWSCTDKGDWNLVSE